MHFKLRRLKFSTQFSTQHWRSAVMEVRHVFLVSVALACFTLFICSSQPKIIRHCSITDQSRCQVDFYKKNTSDTNVLEAFQHKALEFHRWCKTCHASEIYIGNRSGTSDKYGNQPLLRSSIARRTTSTTGTKKLKNNQFLFTNSEARTKTTALITTRTRSVNHNDERNVKRSKRLRSHIPYYANSTATFQLLLLSGDIELNPGWPEDHSRDTDYLQDFAASLCKGKNVLNTAHINIRSLKNKVDEIKMLLHICRFDILAITETHLDKKMSNRQLEIENYKLPS